jgi:hypothetical protein
MRNVAAFATRSSMKPAGVVFLAFGVRHDGCPGWWRAVDESRGPYRWLNRRTGADSGPRPIGAIVAMRPPRPGIRVRDDAQDLVEFLRVVPGPGGPDEAAAAASPR